MSIRARLILVFSICLSVAYGAIAFTVLSSARKSSMDMFRGIADGQLERVEEHIDTFLEPGVMSVKYLAGLDAVKNSRGGLTGYTMPEQAASGYAEPPSQERLVYDEFIRIFRSNRNIARVFMASDDGQFVKAPEGGANAPRGDPRQQLWYREAILSPAEVAVTSPCVPAAGGAVFGIVTRVRDSDGRAFALLGVDYSLNSLISELSDRQILETGYLVVFDKNGRIIADGLDDENVSADPESYHPSRKRMASFPDGTFEELGADGLRDYVATRTAEPLGWKLAVVFDENEMLAPSYEMLRVILITSAIVMIMAFAVLTALARNIVEPIEHLIVASSIISSGEYETSEEVRASLHEKLAVTGSGESRQLALSLRSTLDALRERLEAAYVANKAKGDFLANMSHEIRTPINAVIGMTTIAKSTSDPERKDYCLGRIADASGHLLGIINDILDMSKIESGKFELSLVNFSFERTLRKVASVISFRVSEKKQRFCVSVDERIPDALIGDDQRIAQVITNLLSNAVKFTEEGGVIKLSSRLAVEEGGVCEIETSVEDSGIGISPGQQARLFTSFNQADSGTSRKFGGTGLGLAISKRIVEMMGGRIWIESEEGRGSKFSFTVKAPRGVDEASVQLRRLLAGGLRILVVDSSLNVRDFFGSVMNRFGVSCDLATDAAEARDLMGRNIGYDMFFVDWKSSGLDIADFVGRIGERDPGESVVTMMNASDWNALEREARGAGLRKFLNKPLFPSDISDCISEYLGTKSAVSFSAEAEDSFAGKRILLAEDVEVNREIVTSLLEPTELGIDCARNGSEAVEMFTAFPERYDMIFMDLQMPEMDGYEATRRIRASGAPRADSVPIVAMTANVFREDVERCIESGMNGHVGKPLDFEEVIRELRKYLGGVSSSGENSSDGA